MGRMRREPGECIGSGGLSVPEWDRIEEDGFTTGVCAGCLERLALALDGFLPRHKLQRQFRSRLPL
jgi:hypothetical protein